MLFSTCIQICKSVVLWNPEFLKFSARVAQTRKGSLTGWWRLPGKTELNLVEESRKKGIALARQSSNKPRFYFAPSIRKRSPFALPIISEIPFNKKQTLERKISDFFYFRWKIWEIIKRRKMKKLLWGLFFSCLQAEDNCAKELNILYDKQLEKPAELLSEIIKGLGSNSTFFP